MLSQYLLQRRLLTLVKLEEEEEEEEDVDEKERLPMRLPQLMPRPLIRLRLLMLRQLTRLRLRQPMRRRPRTVPQLRLVTEGTAAATAEEAVTDRQLVWLQMLSRLDLRTLDRMLLTSPLVKLNLKRICLIVIF